MTAKMRFKKLKNGWLSIYIDIHYNGTRSYFYLGIRIRQNPRGALEKNQNKEALQIAQQILLSKQQELLTNKYNVFVPQARVDFIAYAEDYIQQNKNAIEVKCYKAPLKWLIRFIKKNKIYCDEITVVLLQKFAKYLEANLNGQTPVTYLNKIKKIIRQAKEEKLVSFDFSQRIVVSQKTRGIKDVLDFSELKILINTPCNNQEVKRAFLFATLTGLRFCDIKKLQWKQISGDKVWITQQKTKVPLAIVISNDAKQFLGNQKEGSDLVFNLLSHTGSSKSLKNWLTTAGINKHITFHCARHSFGAALVRSGVDIYSVSKLLGHTSLKHTTVYTRYSDEMAKSAMSKLPKLFNNENTINDEKK